MLSPRRLIFLGAAALLSAGTVYMTQQWLQGQLSHAAEAARAQGPATAAVQVLVAGQALPAGRILKASDVRWQAWPANASTAGYLTNGASSPEQVAGAVARADISAGEPLTTARVVQPGERGFLAAVLRPGHRAVTINVSASTGVAGFIFPGDRVDVVLSRSVGDKRFVSETVLTDLRVVGTDQRSSNAKNEVLVPQTATLEVTPKQAEIVTVVTELGKLSLSLRSLAAPGDAEAGQHAVSRTWDNEATQAPAARAAIRVAARPSAATPRPAPTTVEVVRGSSISFVGGAP